MFKKNLFLILFSVCMLDLQMVSAEPAGTLDVATEILYLKYKEPGIMENHGFLYGVSTAYTFRDRAMFKVESRAAVGRADYESRNTGDSESNDEFLFEARGLVGFDLERESYRLTPFIGMGYRYLSDDSSGSITTTGHSGYGRHSNYIYSPLGVEFSTPAYDGWNFGADFEFDIFWFGMQYSQLGDVYSGHPTVKNEQNEGFGIKTSISAEKEFKRNKFLVELFYHYWRIQDSEIEAVTYNGSTSYYYEPRNTTQEIGLRFIFKF